MHFLFSFSKTYDSALKRAPDNHPISHACANASRRRVKKKKYGGGGGGGRIGSSREAREKRIVAFYREPRRDPSYLRYERARIKKKPSERVHPHATPRTATPPRGGGVKCIHPHFTHTVS